MMRRLLAIVLLLPILAGCLHHRCTIPPEAMEPCREVSCACRHKVYIALLHGFDPCDTHELESVRNTLNDLGYTKTFYGHWYHVGDFAEEINKAVDCDPQIQVVIICSGMGVEPGHELAYKLDRSGVHVSSMICIDAPYWASSLYDAPPDVGHVCYVQKSSGWLPPEGSPIEVLGLEPVKGTTLATHPDTVNAVLTELAAHTKLIPEIPKKKSEMAFANPAPTPRPVYVEKSPDDDWDFLHPVARLAAPGKTGSQPWTVAKPEEKKEEKK